MNKSSLNKSYMTRSNNIDFGNFGFSQYNNNINNIFNFA